MTKYPKFVKKGAPVLAAPALLALVVCGFAACINPIGFTPELKFSLDANVSGDIDVYNANNAVLWVINYTKSVHVGTQKIEVINGTVPAGYPMTYNDTPKAGHSFASYHRPHPPREKNASLPAQPYQYKVTLDLRDTKNNNAEQSLFIEKQLPLAKDYAVFLIRRADGTLDLVDEEPSLNALDPDDTSEPPVPPPSGTPRFPLIVRNVTKNADIEFINFGNFLTEAQPVYANMNDQKTWFLPADDYSPAFVSYRLKSSQDTGVSVHNNVGPRVTVINKDAAADSASWHLLFMYFYLSTDGSYKITQQWPPAMNDVDEQGNIEGDFDHARIRVWNKVTATYVTSVSLVKNNESYTVESDDFIPAGVIGPSEYLRDSKVSRYSPTAQAGFGPFTGESYDVILRVVDERHSSTRPGQIFVRRKGVNLMLGETRLIVLSPSDIDEGEGVVIVDPDKITYTVTANGGAPALQSAPEYTTTQLTLTFSEDPGVITVNKVSGTTVFGSLSGSGAVRTLPVTVSQPENVILNVTGTDVETGNKVVTVFKQHVAPPQFIPITQIKMHSKNAAHNGDYELAQGTNEFWYEILPHEATNKSPVHFFKGLIANSNCVQLSWTPDSQDAWKGDLTITMNWNLYAQNEPNVTTIIPVLNIPIKGTLTNQDKTHLNIMGYVPNGKGNTGTTSVGFGADKLSVDEYWLITNANIANTDLTSRFLQETGKIGSGSVPGKPFSDPAITFTKK